MTTSSYEALFCLPPISKGALAVVDSIINRPYVGVLDGVCCIEVGVISSKSRDTLITFRYGHEADIIVDNRRIANLQCAFRIDFSDLPTVMFYDLSHNHSTDVGGCEAVPF